MGGRGPTAHGWANVAEVGGSRNGFGGPRRTVGMPTEPETDYDGTLGDKFIFVTGGVMSGLGKGKIGRAHV